jgi:hypothetical protein
MHGATGERDKREYRPFQSLPRTWPVRDLVMERICLAAPGAGGSSAAGDFSTAGDPPIGDGPTADESPPPDLRPTNRRRRTCGRAGTDTQPATSGIDGMR